MYAHKSYAPKYQLPPNSGAKWISVSLGNNGKKHWRFERLLDRSRRLHHFLVHCIKESPDVFMLWRAAYYSRSLMQTARGSVCSAPRFGAVWRLVFVHSLLRYNFSIFCVVFQMLCSDCSTTSRGCRAPGCESSIMFVSP